MLTWYIPGPCPGGQMGSTGLGPPPLDSPAQLVLPNTTLRFSPKEEAETQEEALPFLWLSQQIYSVISLGGALGK